MVRLLGVTLPDKKRVEISLCYIYGISRPLSGKILKSAGISFDKKAGELTDEELNKIQSFIEKNYKVEGDLRREVQANIKRLKEIGSYRGMRHSRKLPVRGQRTKTNSRTVRGNVRRTVGSGKRKTELR
jgi:small subunit ribosomal protein S13